jgi:hypothetical protein
VSPRRAPDRADVVAGEAGAVAVLDTTAQLLQALGGDYAEEGAREAPDPAEALTRRARAKLATDAIVGELCRLGSETPLRHAYLRTMGCATELTQEGAKLTGRYCGNRWCGVCNRIRTAKLRTAYTPVLLEWGDAHFVTVTVPNVPRRELHATVRRLIQAVREIANNIRRTDRLEWRAVRKLEVTFNAERRDFHPHVHLVVKGQAQSRTFVKRWLERFPDANAGAQDVRPATGEGAMRELFKYLTKQTVRVDGRVTTAPARALDAIYVSVRGLRTIQPMGFKVKGEPDEVTDEDATLELDATITAPREHAVWRWCGTDWVDPTTGELLTGWEPEARIYGLIANVMRDAWPPGEKPPPDPRPPGIRIVT